MKIAVWDTYVRRNDGRLMHFDILVPESLGDQKQIEGFGNQYLTKKGIEVTSIKWERCNFCHIEHPSESTITAINADGFSIIEMENCDSQ